jgi:hypothetical protein
MTKNIIIGILALLSLNSCKKLIAVKPSGTQLLTSDVFTDSATVQETLAGMYTTLSYGIYSYPTSTIPGFSADELSYVGNTNNQYIDNGIPITDPNVESIWSNSYNVIYIANSIIEGVAGSSGISTTFKSQATAEAEFIRAFCYFHLVSFFGDVPLILTTDVATNSLLPRTPTAQVYSQMVSDLKFAQSNLPADYSISSGARTRANKWVATALLARVYLYTSDWVDAEAQATAVIGNTALFSLPTNLTTVFTPTSTEAIWQFYNQLDGYTQYAYYILPNPVSLVPTYILTPELVSAFEPGDARQTNWTSTLVYGGTTYTYPSKYKSLATGANAEYYTVLRLAEQYLIRAEARAEQNNVTGAQADISAIRNRAGLANTTASDQTSLLAAVAQERRVELNCELGHRWFDLKRTGTVNTVIGALKPATWKSTAALYPISSSELVLDANLVQNPGY